MELNLPKDAEGNVIPSNVTTMYKKNGTQVHVGNLVYSFTFKSWRVIAGREVLSPSRLYLNKPDTLEQLAADLDRLFIGSEMYVCQYFNRDKGKCRGCKFEKDRLDEFGFINCTKPFLLDVAARVHRLCGDAE